MDRDTYTNPNIIKKINEHFIPIKFNPEIKDVTYNIDDKSFKPEELYQMLTNGNATGFPTTYFIFTKKMSLQLEPGYKDSVSFNALLDAAIAESKK
jgi:thioredoxin-related protein